MALLQVRTTYTLAIVHPNCHLSLQPSLLQWYSGADSRLGGTPTYPERGGGETWLLKTAGPLPNCERNWANSRPSYEPLACPRTRSGPMWTDPRSSYAGWSGTTCRGNSAERFRSCLRVSFSPKPQCPRGHRAEDTRFYQASFSCGSFNWIGVRSGAFFRSKVSCWSSVAIPMSVIWLPVRVEPMLRGTLVMHRYPNTSL